MQRNRLILRTDYDELHDGMRRMAKVLDWQIIDEPPESAEDLGRLVILETLGLVIPTPATPPEQLGPLDSEGLPAWDDDQTVEAPAVTEIELEGVPDDVPRQTAPMLTFGAAGGTVEHGATVHETVAAEAIKVDAVPSLDEYIRAGYDPAEYDRFVAEWQKEQGEAVARYVAAINAEELPRQTAPMLTFGAANLTVDDIEQPEQPEEPEQLFDGLPTLEQFTAQGYLPENYERFIAARKAERADERFIGAALPPGDGLERPATELQSWDDE
jgi:hypothetical protein